MSSENNKNYILIVDDIEDDFKYIARELRKYNIQSIYADSAEEMEEKLKNIYHKLTAIILDLKGKIKKDQELERPDFISAAIRIIDSHPNYKNIPKFIVSGSPADFDKYKDFNSEIKSYRKNKNDLESVAKEIINIGKEFDYIKIRNSNELLFDSIDKNFKAPIEREILDIYININSDDSNKIKEYLGVIRRITEHIYKTAITKVQKEECTTFAKINKIFAGNRDYKNKAKPQATFYYDDYTIEYAMNYIHWVCSVHGAHDNETLEFTQDAVDAKNFPTNYTLKTALFALCDIILWYERFLEKWNK